MTTETAGELTLRVGDFEGPLDLLLHLCRTSEIDLAALPVRTITDQYLAHLEAIEFRDLETAGAYLVMAATLIYLKSKLLVPPDESETEELDEEGQQLRQQLEDRLREYARVKALGGWLATREAEQALIWATKMADKEATQALRRNLYANWWKKNKDAVQKWLDSNKELTAEERQECVEQAEMMGTR